MAKKELKLKSFDIWYTHSFLGISFVRNDIINAYSQEQAIEKLKAPYGKIFEIKITKIKQLKELTIATI